MKLRTFKSLENEIKTIKCDYKKGFIVLAVWMILQTKKSKNWTPHIQRFQKKYEHILTDPFPMNPAPPVRIRMPLDNSDILFAFFHVLDKNKIVDPLQKRELAKMINRCFDLPHSERTIYNRINESNPQILVEWVDNLNEKKG